MVSKTFGISNGFTRKHPFGGKNIHNQNATTQWSPFKEESNYFEPSKKDFMFNYRVANLEHSLGRSSKRRSCDSWQF